MKSLSHNVSTLFLGLLCFVFLPAVSLGLALGGEGRRRRQRLQQKIQEWRAEHCSLPRCRRRARMQNNDGTLSCWETRELYKGSIKAGLKSLDDLGLPDNKDKANLAYDCRQTNEVYARERCESVGRIFSVMFDAYKTYLTTGEWNPLGLTFQQLWEEKEKKVRKERRGETLSKEDLEKYTAQEVIKSAGSTNSSADELAYCLKTLQDGNASMILSYTKEVALSPFLQYAIFRNCLPAPCLRRLGAAQRARQRSDFAIVGFARTSEDSTN